MKWKQIMVKFEFEFQTYMHRENNTKVEIFSDNNLVLATPELRPRSITNFAVDISIPTKIKITAQGARVLIKKVSINNFTIDIYDLFPSIVNISSGDNYQVSLHNNELSFNIDDDIPTRWLMRNKNRILIDRTADIIQSRDYNYE